MPVEPPVSRAEVANRWLRGTAIERRPLFFSSRASWPRRYLGGLHARRLGAFTSDPRPPASNATVAARRCRACRQQAPGQAAGARIDSFVGRAGNRRLGGGRSHRSDGAGPPLSAAAILDRSADVSYLTILLIA